MKKILFLLLLAGGAGGGYYYWKILPAAAAAKTEAQKVPTAKVERGLVRLTVASTGRVIPKLDVEIKCKASGEVLKLPFDVSDPVEKGKLVLEVDPAENERMLKQAEVDLSSSQAKLVIARQNLVIALLTIATNRERAAAALRSVESRAQDARTKADRLKKLLEKQLASQEEADTAETTAVQAVADLENARTRIKELEIEELGLKVKEQEVVLAAAQVENDQIDRSLAKQRLDDTTVVSPIKGVVTSRKVEIGQIIASGVSNVGGGTAVMTISDLSRIFVVASVDESDIGKVEVGQAVVITADAFRGKRFRGKVDRKTPKGVVVSNVVTFEVKIEVLDERKSLLQPEMTANVEILIAEKKDALNVPSEAVIRQRAQYVASVLKDDGTTEERPVEVGINDGIKVEVTKGLGEGDVVVIRKGAGDSAWRKANKGGTPGMMFGAGRPGR